MMRNVKTCIILALFIGLLLPGHASALKGTVEKVDLCRPGNIMFKTATGWYVNARHLSGIRFKEKDVVSGKMKNYGIQFITNAAGQRGKYYILNFQKNRQDAIDASCGSKIRH